MKVKELIELLGRLKPNDDISIAIAVRGDTDDEYQNYTCCEHFIVNECSCGESELLGLDLDLWEDERYRSVFCKSYKYPESKFSESKKKEK